MAAERGQLRIGHQRLGGEVEQPRADHAAAAPDLGHLRHVDVELVVLRLAHRRRLGVGGVLLLADVGVLEDVEAFGERGHHSVLDAVVHHLHEVAGAVRAAVQEAVLGVRRVAGAPGRALRGADARRQRLEDGREVVEDFLLGAHHQAVAAILAGDAAAGAAIHVMEAGVLELPGAVDVVAVVGVAAVDDDVARIQVRDQVVQHLVDDAGRHHHPDGARLVHLAGEFLEVRGAAGPRGHQLGHRVGVRIRRHALVALAHHATRHVGAHPSQSDHSELHCWLSKLRAAIIAHG